MSYMDLIGLASLVLAALSFLAPSFTKLSGHKKTFEAIGWFFLGFIASRVAYALLPAGASGAIPNYRVLVWGTVITVAVILILTALKREGTNSAIWVLFIVMAYLSLYGKSIGLITQDDLRDDETLIVVDAKERTGEFDRALELLQKMSSGRSKEESDAIAKRIQEINGKKLQKISTQP
jgi:hypothetical protein